MTRLKEINPADCTADELAQLIVNTVNAVPPNIRRSKLIYAEEVFREVADLIEEQGRAAAPKRRRSAAKGRGRKETKR